jgi:RHS repeat-associated protein
VSRVENRARAENRTYAVTDRRVSIDGNGNLVGDGRQWDARDRLVSNGYGYDTGNLRVKMGAQEVLLDGIEEAREYGTEVKRYDHDPSRVDGLLAQKTSAGKGYFITDALGSVYAIVDSTGAEVSKYSYDVYGARTAVTEGMATSWGFTGRRHDSAAEMYYRARYLSATAGGFMSSDPLGLAAGNNLYLYGAARPTFFTDPEGRAPWVDTNGMLGSQSVVTQALANAERSTYLSLQTPFLFQKGNTRYKDKPATQWEWRLFDWREAQVYMLMRAQQTRVTVCVNDPFFKKNEWAGAYTTVDDYPGTLKIVIPSTLATDPWKVESMLFHELIHTALWNTPLAGVSARVPTLAALEGGKDISWGRFPENSVSYENSFTEVAAYMGSAQASYGNPARLDTQF